MRRVQAEFMNFTLQNHDVNLNYEHGPSDQGALNTFFKDKMDVLPVEYNWKPYWEYKKDYYILHFHGSKAHEYQQFFKTRIMPPPPYNKHIKQCDVVAQNCEKNVAIYHYWAKKLD